MHFQVQGSPTGGNDVYERCARVFVADVFPAMKGVFMIESVLSRRIAVPSAVSRAILVGVAFICIFLSGFVRIPLFFTPVPMTLQTFFVLLCPALIGGRAAVLPAALMILAGLGGLPAPMALTGPTGGYFFGFVFAAAAIALGIKYAKDSSSKLFCLFIFAEMCILGSGMAWLAIVYKFSWRAAFTAGVLPFIGGDIIKAAAAVFAARRIRS